MQSTIGNNADVKFCRATNIDLRTTSSYVEEMKLFIQKLEKQYAHEVKVRRRRNWRKAKR